jgi:hypothetical protein
MYGFREKPDGDAVISRAGETAAVLTSDQMLPFDIADCALSAIGGICRRLNRANVASTSILPSERMTAGRFDPCATAQVPQDPDGLSAPALGPFPYVHRNERAASDAGQSWNTDACSRTGRR